MVTGAAEPQSGSLLGVGVLNLHSISTTVLLLLSIASSQILPLRDRVDFTETSHDTNINEQEYEQSKLDSSFNKHDNIKTNTVISQ